MMGIQVIKLKEVSKVTHHIRELQHHFPLPVQKQKTRPKTASFKDVFQTVQDLKVSKHAQQRINERNIRINDKQWEVIAEKMKEAKYKGVTDSLVVTKDAALLVSTKNNTIVTAMNHQEASSKIFTNINGTIVINE